MKNEKNIYIAHSHNDIMEGSFTSYSTEVNKRKKGIEIIVNCVSKWQGDLAQGIEKTSHESEEVIFINYPCALVEIEETVCSGPISKDYWCTIYRDNKQEINISANNNHYSEKNTARLNFIIALLEKESLTKKDVEDAKSL